MNSFKKRLRSSRGATAIEYSFILGLFSFFMIFSFGQAGGPVQEEGEFCESISSMFGNHCDGGGSTNNRE